MPFHLLAGVVPFPSLNQLSRFKACIAGGKVGSAGAGGGCAPAEAVCAETGGVVGGKAGRPAGSLPEGRIGAVSPCGVSSTSSSRGPARCGGAGRISLLTAALVRLVSGRW